MNSKNYNNHKQNESEEINSQHSGSDASHHVCSQCRCVESLHRSDSIDSSIINNGCSRKGTNTNTNIDIRTIHTPTDINFRRSAFAQAGKQNTSPLSECSNHDHLHTESYGFNTIDRRKTISGSCSDINNPGSINYCTTSCSHSVIEAINRSSNKKRTPSMTSLCRSSSTTAAVRPFSMSLDVARSKKDKLHETKDWAKETSNVYLTPLQRKDREAKDLKKEIVRLHQELRRKEERMLNLEQLIEEQSREYREELDRCNNDTLKLLEEKERVEEEGRREKTLVEEELSKMDTAYTELKVKQQLQEDQFQERYLDMYKRGQKAAKFERDQELEMIASSKQPKVTVRELTRKLSITESELAKWQSLRLDETYKSAGKPATDADVTLSFLKDSFYHFVCDGHDSLRHFRAMIEIFKYSDKQMTTIRKAISESKDFSRLFKKDIDKK